MAQTTEDTELLERSMQTGPFSRLTHTVFVGLVVAVLTGCPEEAAEITEVKATSLDFAVSPVGLVNFATGSSSRDNVLVVFDESVPDAFGRSVAGNDPFYSSTARGDAANGTDFGPGWNFAGFERNSTTDPRLPALVEDDAVLPADDGFVIGDPAEVGAPGFHNPFTEGSFTGLEPTTTYVVALARLGTMVNGELDQEQVLLGDPVDDPDDLVYLGGSPAGDPTVPIITFPTIIAFQANANPYVLGNFTTDVDGVGGFDVVINGGGNLYTTDSGDPSDADFDLSLVARNDDTGTTFPRYNYLVIFEGPAVDAADAADNPQAVRVQMAQDVEAGTGQPINNTFAPFRPTAFSQAELAAAPGSQGSRPDSISVEARHMEALAGSNRWQAWLANRDEDPVTYTAAIGRYERIAILREIDPLTGEVTSEEDSLLDAMAMASSFRGQLEEDLGGDRGVQEIKHRFVFSDASVGQLVGNFTDVVFTQESGTGATTPSSSQAVWFWYTDQNGTPGDLTDDGPGPLVGEFGRYSSMPLPFTEGDITQSSGVGGVRESPGDPMLEVSVEIRNLPRPPVGFYYEGWLVSPDGNTMISLGPLTSLPPNAVSFFEADVDETLPDVTPTGIRFAVARGLFEPDAIVSPDGDAFTVNLNGFAMTLEAKVGAETPNAAVLETGTLPTEALIERRQ